MGIRLQVVMSESELDEIRAVATRNGMNVSEWVRRVLREERARERTGKPPQVREAGASYGVSTGEESITSARGRVRVELDLRESLLDRVQARYHLPTRRAAVEFALRRVVVEPMTREEALDMEGAGWDGDLEQTRSGDPGAVW